jgi:hypothetical protein
MLLASPLSALAGCHDDVVAVMRSALTIGPVERLIFTAESGDAPIAAAILVPPVRVSATNINSYGAPNKIIVIGERGWQDNGKRWVEMPRDWALQQLAAYGPPTQSVIDSLKAASCDGPMQATENGHVVYEIHTKTRDVPVTLSLDVDEDTMLPLQMKIVESENGEPGPATVITYRYDDTLTVEAPTVSAP